MTQEQDISKLTKAINRLSLVVIVLVSILIVFLYSHYYIHETYEEKIQHVIPDNIGINADLPYQTNPSPPTLKTLEERIEQASFIALVEFNVSEGEKVTAIITEFLKETPNLTIHYKVGDEHPHSSYYPREGVRLRDGAILFFQGSPAINVASTFIYDNRISAYGDMPVEMFKSKVRGE